jgi:hypothetical protein
VRHHHHHARSVLVALLAAVALMLGLATPAAGQATTSDPYGSTVPPTEPPGDPSCEVDSAVGATVTGSIAGLTAGTEVDLVLGGEVLATLVAGSDGVAEFSVDVPGLAGVLVAVGVTFNVECDDPGEVLGETEERPGTENGGGGVLGSGNDNSSGGGALARTGATIVPLVVLALIALAVGAYLRKRSRSREGHLAV